MSVLREKQLRPQENDSRKMEGLKEWINGVLTCATDMDAGNPEEFERLLDKSKEASRKLHDLLTSFKPIQNEKAKCNKENEDNKARFDGMSPQKYYQRQSLTNSYMNRARQIFDESPVPEKIAKLVKTDKLMVKSGIAVPSHIGVQTELLRMLLSFHPVWLKLALETVIRNRTVVSFTEPKADYVFRISRFILQYVFADYAILNGNRKFVYGTAKRVLTPAGMELMHKDFLTKLCQALFMIENLVVNRVIPNLPCIREIMAGTSLLPKALAQIGFDVCYKQGFFEEYNYKVDNFLPDLSDGVILAKLTELTAIKNGHQFVDIISQLRNPGGDRIRKLHNQRVVLDKLVQLFPNKIQPDEFRPDDIVDRKSEVVVDLVWRLVGLFTEYKEVDLTTNISQTQRLGAAQLHSSSQIYRSSLTELNRLQREVERIRRRFLSLQEKENVEPSMNVRIEVDDKATLMHFNQIQETAAIKIQCLIRKFLASRNVQKLKIRREKELQEKIQRIQDQAAIKIQSLVRRYLARCEYERIRKQIQDQAATKIQSLFRGHLARCEYERIRKQVQEQAAIKIQALIRRYLARCEYERIRKQVQEQAAIKIQSRIRGYLARCECERIRKQIQDQAATKIQSLYRGHLARCEYERIRKHVQEQAAIKIQSLVRRYLARCEYERIRKQRRDSIPFMDEDDVFLSNEIREEEAVVKVEPINLRIERYLDGMLSENLSIRRLCALRLNRLAKMYPFLADSAIQRCGLEVILDSFDGMNRSEAHLLVTRPLSSLLQTLLTNSKVVQPFAEKFMEDLVKNSIKQIHNNYKDEDIVKTNANVLQALKSFTGFQETLKDAKFEWHLDQLRKHFHRLPSTDARYIALNVVLDKLIAE
ncbi:IQ calmodulin-binding motif domain-containing protein [Ditylenchus destructor]|uniref:IQ calmodulin-binding motif domain-containing protein n=1 Tax=Ditylenchus destructor TaxID=166010 RepID=A0AAD4R6Z2_9BILA|nr:IQ calmodulin-binding motif domain-containing protein [Ditylenchus destructor]